MTNLSAVNSLMPSCVGDADAMRIEEAGDAGDGAHAIAGELVLEHVDLMVERHAQPRAEILALDVLFDAVGEAVEAALAPAAQIEDGFAQGLGRDGAGVDRDAADARRFSTTRTSLPSLAA